MTVDDIAMVMQKGEVNGSIRKRESEIGPSSSFSPNSLRLPRKDYLNLPIRIDLHLLGMLLVMNPIPV